MFFVFVVCLLIITISLIINELFLMLQGIAAMTDISIPCINELLLGAAAVLFAGILLLNLSQRNTN